ncbi:MAG: hypothetical protein Q9161_009571 [Pseudevernia consocians]
MSSSTPTEIVKKLLSNTLNPEVVREVVAPDATYVSLNYDNPDLTKILPYAGSHTKAGPQAIIDTFATVNRIWAKEAFDIQTLFGAGEDVAVFGSFTYRSRSLGQVSVSPFSIWCKVNEDGKVTYMQFMEDTLGSTNSFQKGGQKQYVVLEEKGEIEV